MRGGAHIDAPEDSATGAPGIAPIVALALTAILGAAGAVLFLARDRVEARQSAPRTEQAFRLAETALAGGRDALAAPASIGGETTPERVALALRAAAGENGVVDLDTDDLHAERAPDGTIAGLAGFGDDVPLVGPVRQGDGWYATFLSVSKGDDREPGEDEVVLLTGVGTAPDGSIEIVQGVVDPSLGRSAGCGEVEPSAPADDETATCAPMEVEPVEPAAVRDVVRYRQR